MLILTAVSYETEIGSEYFTSLLGNEIVRERWRTNKESCVGFEKEILLENAKESEKSKGWKKQERKVIYLVYLCNSLGQEISLDGADGLWGDIFPLLFCTILDGIKHLNGHLICSHLI